MSQVERNTTQRGTGWLVVCALLVTILALPLCVLGKDKKAKADATPEKKKVHYLDTLDYSKIVWPNPPAITRVKYLSYFSGEKYKPPQEQRKKAGWMDRLAGVSVGNTPKDEKPRFQLVMPYGICVDSKGIVYIADRKVSAVFMVNFDTGDFQMIKNGVHAHFEMITGMTMDDSDRLYVSDSPAGRVLIFDPQHKVEGAISQGLRDPGGLAVDNENRILYVADAELDQILVYDADPPHKLLRRIGTAGKDHRLTSSGDFSKPTNVAVDKDGNLYVSDTWNNRIQVFDADGNFIRTFGKAGDGPGYFARPKGLAVDNDGHIWVADAVQDRVQVFTPEGQLLLYMGGHGMLPGQFNTVVDVFIDKDNRVFTSEQFPGRVQMFRYITNAEAKAELERRQAEDKKKEEQKKTAGAAAKDVAAKPQE